MAYGFGSAKLVKQPFASIITDISKTREQFFSTMKVKVLPDDDDDVLTEKVKNRVSRLSLIKKTCFTTDRISHYINPNPDEDSEDELEIKIHPLNQSTIEYEPVHVIDKYSSNFKTKSKSKTKSKTKSKIVHIKLLKNKSMTNTTDLKTLPWSILFSLPRKKSYTLDKIENNPRTILSFLSHST